MQQLARENGLNWQVDSAGTGSWHLGKSPDRRSIRVARKYGVDISGQVCRLFSVDDFDAFDLILVMDNNNLRDVLSMARDDEDAKKVRLLLADKVVPDPYYDDDLFEPVFKLIVVGCKEIIQQQTS